MLLRKGIERKTFLYSALLIILVVLLSFAVLYLAMPGYYHRQKTQTLERNLNLLTIALFYAEDEEECATLIADFSERNNATILAFAGEYTLLPGLSTPFLAMRGPNSFIAPTAEQRFDGATQEFIIRMRPDIMQQTGTRPGAG